MQRGQGRHAAFGSDWMNTAAATGQWLLPPDVEPLPEHIADPLRHWLEKQHIAACDRGAACRGFRVGEALGELVLAAATLFKAARLRKRSSAVLALDVRSRASLPRLRRAPFYRRARALQFKRIRDDDDPALTPDRAADVRAGEKAT